MDGLKNILLVEDDAMIRELYRTALVKAQYTVRDVASADELYALLVDFHPDCIFLDIMLPDTSGLEILNELRTNPELKCMDAKVVILTNLAQRSVTDNAIERGADGYVIKADILPNDLPEIIKSLEE